MPSRDGRPKRRTARSVRRPPAPAPDDSTRAELQRTRTELTELRAENRELMIRIAALESELSTARKQIDLMQHAPPRPRAIAHEPSFDAGARPRGRAFGTALMASLLGLGLRAVRRG